MPRAPTQSSSRQPSKPYIQSPLSFPTTGPKPTLTTPKSEFKVPLDQTPRSDSKAKYKAKGGEYNKQLLLSLVIKSANPNWEALGPVVGKTPVQCRDTWRKTICPALLEGRDWSASGPGWDSVMKVAAVVEVITSAKPDWAVLGNVMEGKTATQVKDVWRKVVLPRPKKGMTVE